MVPIMAVYPPSGDIDGVGDNVCGHDHDDDNYRVQPNASIDPVFLGGQYGPDYGSLPALRRSTYHQGAAAQSHLEEIFERVILIFPFRFDLN